MMVSGAPLMWSNLFLLLLLLLSCIIVNDNAVVDGKPLVEAERLDAYYARNYTWPMTTVKPNTDGWRHLMLRRLAQVERIKENRDRYNGWVATMASAWSVTNYTENGWGLARAPSELVEELKRSLHDGLPNAKPEMFINVIEADDYDRPLFVKQGPLNGKVLRELKPMHEEWSGVELIGSMAYGLRVYRNNTVLNNHVDKIRTHVISSILHIDHSEDSEPWPIYIEDFQGNRNEVVLESGDMLFYESSKCLHGRPRRFNGSWYSSIFTHYYPRGFDQHGAELENHYSIPPHWHTAEPPDERLEELIMVGTSMKEPECRDQWCGLNDTVKWYGPAKEGIVITTGYQPEDATTTSSEEL